MTTAATRTGRTTRRVETPAESKGRISLLRCIQATVNMAAMRTMASERRSKIMTILLL